AYGSLADLAAALGHPYEGGGPQQSTQATPGIEMTDLPENQPLSEAPFSEDGTGQLQNTPLLMQVNLPYHQVLSTPEVSHLFQVLAGVIERQPAFLEALQQLVARFTPQPQEMVDNPNRPTLKETRQDPRFRRKNERSRSPHRTSQRGDEEPTQRTQEMQDGGHLTPVRLTEQDGDRPPQTSAPPLNEGTFQGHPLKQTKPPASETNDDKEWPLLGISSRKRKLNSQPMRNADESTPRLFPVQTVVLRSVGKKEVSAFTGKEIREAIESAGIQAQADYTVHRNEKANALAITTRDPLLTEKLLKIKAIRQGEDTNALQPYKALAGNQCRGVVYLRGQNNEVTPEQLQEDIECRTHKLVAARPLGTKGNTILVTFEGRTRPQRVSYMHEVLPVPGLHLCNEPDTPTRLAQSSNQNDTSPDLTWTSSNLRVQWQVQADPMGSDHLPIHIRLLIRTSSRRQVTFTKWDSYRTAMTRLAGVPFAERIQHALREARTEYNVKEDTPQPDLHLINLWDRRLEALRRYRIRRSLQNKIRLNHATAEAKKYTIELCRTNWRKLCDSFNERIGYRALWRAYKGLAGKTKTCNTGSNLALRLDISEEQLAAEAGDYFFPQQPEPPQTDVYVRQPIQNEHPADAFFTLAELQDALATARARSAPGPDLQRGEVFRAAS
ncbi:hypothetical protein HPB47_019148, partial [Ixodes persulcatus]